MLGIFGWFCRNSEETPEKLLISPARDSRVLSRVFISTEIPARLIAILKELSETTSFSISLTVEWALPIFDPLRNTSYHRSNSLNSGLLEELFALREFSHPSAHSNRTGIKEKLNFSFRNTDKEGISVLVCISLVVDNLSLTLLIVEPTIIK